MKVTYTSRATQSKDYPLLQQVTKRLENIIGPAANTVQVRWDQTLDDNARPIYILSLSDATGSTAASFTPAQLTRESYLRIVLHGLWADLLAVHSDIQHRKVEEMVAQLEAQGS